MNKIKLQELESNVLCWANQKKLLFEENKFRQFAKFIEETGETSHEIIKQDVKKMQMEIGDELVTLIIMSKQCGFNVSELSFDSNNVLLSEFEIFKLQAKLRGEIAKFLLKSDAYMMKKIIAEYIYTLEVISYSYMFDLLNCLEMAYNKISGRKGETVNGIFIKSES